jgi:methylmalonyl-CoA mutase C-terminal domain/subunit
MNAKSIKVLIAKPGLDGHDVGAKLICRALRDAGMDAIYSGLRQSPEEIAAAVVREQAAVVGLSIMSGAHLPLCRKVAAALRDAGVDEKVLWIVGGNIPARDHEALHELGVAGVFPVGAPFEDVVDFIRGRIEP